MKYMLITTIVFAVLVVLWGVGSWLVVKDIEMPVYTVAAQTDAYEMRHYEPMIVAETTVTETTGRRSVAESGFMIVADYIFGNNTTNAKIAMTAPVLSGGGEKIAMTAPVLAEGKKVAFVMPQEYSLETLPQPNDARVQLREMPARVLAVKQFSWTASDARIAQAEAGLMSALARDGVEVVGEPFYAGYNPPLSAPFMQRHEVMVEVIAH